MQLSPRIEALAGYTPVMGRLVGMLNYARHTTLAAVTGLSLDQLDHRHDAASNSIGALLSHIAVVERSYQILTFESRGLTEEENARWAPALKLGTEGQRTLIGRTVESYLTELADVRRTTLDSLAMRDDAWLEESVAIAPRMNMHWAWFHVAEEEINHRGQIRWLRSRLPNFASPHR